MSKVLDGAVQARNEDYQSKQGLNAEQLAYDEQWRRLQEVYAGRLRRPWIVIGLKQRPTRGNRRGDATFTARPLTAEQRFVYPEELDVVTMSDVPAKQVKRGARHTRFNVMVLNGYTDELGRPCVGGNDRFCVRLLDFAKPPIQDHPLFNQVGEIDRRRLTAFRAGQFEIVKSDRWVDLCVGVNADDGKPAVLYRLPNEPDQLKHVTFSKAGKFVQKDALLAVLEEPVRFFTASFDGAGQPIMDRIVSDVLSATRNVELFRLLNRMHKLSTDMTLLSPSQRPQIVPAEEWLPRVYVQLRGSTRPKLKDSVVQQRLFQALGPRGTFCIEAPCCGQLQELVPVEGQEHLVEVVIKYDPSIERPKGTRAPTQTALIDGCVRFTAPASLVLRKPVGSVVLTGQPVADYCKRIAFTDWATVEGVIGEENSLLVLNDFLERLPIQPGQFDWEGPGRLWPIDVVEEIPPQARWVWDIEPALPYLNEDGTIVGPAIKQQHWNDFTFGDPGTAQFDLTPAFKRLASREEPAAGRGKGKGKGKRPQPQAAAPAEPSKKKRRPNSRQRRKAKERAAAAQAAAAVATVDEQAPFGDVLDVVMEPLDTGVSTDGDVIEVLMPTADDTTEG